jgi:acyl dehydratase
MEAGQQLPTRTYRVTRADLVRYAGASGDFNPIHWSQRTAEAVGLPGVIAHGMLTMALAGRALTDWAGAPDAVIDFGVRFTRPVPVPDDDKGTEVEVSARVKSVEAGRAELELTATCQGEKVLGRARAVIST